MAGKPNSQGGKKDKRRPPWKAVILSIIRAPKRYYDRYIRRHKEPETEHQRHERMLAEWTARLGKFTLLLVIITGVTGYILWRESEDTRERERAFVFIDTLQSSVSNGNLIITPKWRNGGDTRTKNMTNWVTWLYYRGSDPNDDPNFSFPDYDGSNTLTKVPAGFSYPRIFIGPHAVIAGWENWFPPDVINLIRAGEEKVIVYGWARYEDVFGGKHITRFCDHVILSVLPNQTTNMTELIPVFPGCRRHNCTDDECAEQGLP